MAQHQATCRLPSEIVHLNVGGKRFSTSRQTLTWVRDSFFSSLLGGRISSSLDETGAVFIDRDPKLFSRVLNYLRTKEIDLSGVDLHALRHEAEFYGIVPMVRRLLVCEQLDRSSCGDVLFHGIISPPPSLYTTHAVASRAAAKLTQLSQNVVSPTANTSVDPQSNSSLDSQRLAYVDSTVANQTADGLPNSQQVAASLLRPAATSGHTDAENLWKVSIIKGHFNWIVVAYPHLISLYRMKDSAGWHLAWTSPYLAEVVERVALNAKVLAAGQETCNRMVAATHGDSIRLWSVSLEGQQHVARQIGQFQMHVDVDSLFFIDSQLAAISQRGGKVGVWHAMTHNWQVQDVVPISSYDTAGTFLLLGGDNGSIYYIDMQKFPLRMKDNDLLITELYRDPGGDRITALSVYLTSKTSLSGNWIEIAYGTSAGIVRVIVQHPECVGQGPQLFQTFTVHTCAISRVMLSEKHLVSVCSESNHVRTWNVTRFRGMISTQPGSMPLASFKVITLEDFEPQAHYEAGNNFGPFGERDDQQLFVQKVVPETDRLFIRLSSTGQRVCVIRSVDGSLITSFCVHECEGSSRMGYRPRRYLFTGHSNGNIQMWDLSTALELSLKNGPSTAGGPNADELVRLLDHCDLATGSCQSTPTMSRSSSGRAAACGLSLSAPYLTNVMKHHWTLDCNETNIQSPEAVAPPPSTSVLTRPNSVAMTRQLCQPTPRPSSIVPREDSTEAEPNTLTHV